MRPPPRSTLFPYTTLFRSVPDRHVDRNLLAALKGGSRKLDQRSEEHTSELQSRGHLVCRLLLEKKKAEAATSACLGPAAALAVSPLPPCLARTPPVVTSIC